MFRNSSPEEIRSIIEKSRRNRQRVQSYAAATRREAEQAQNLQDQFLRSAPFNEYEKKRMAQIKRRTGLASLESFLPHSSGNSYGYSAVNPPMRNPFYIERGESTGNIEQKALKEFIQQQLQNPTEYGINLDIRPNSASSPFAQPLSGAYKHLTEKLLEERFMQLHQQRAGISPEVLEQAKRNLRPVEEIKGDEDYFSDEEGEERRNYYYPAGSSSHFPGHNPNIQGMRNLSGDMNPLQLMQMIEQSQQQQQPQRYIKIKPKRNIYQYILNNFDPELSGKFPGEH